MNAVIEAIAKHAATGPSQTALIDSTRSVSYGALVPEIERLAAWLMRLAPKAVAIVADNSVGWALADLAALAAGVTLIPIPAYFSTQQLRHVVSTAEVDFVLTDQPVRIVLDLRIVAPDTEPFTGSLRAIRITSARLHPSDDAIAKVTFTSGTTGTPKGVRLHADHLAGVARSLVSASDARRSDRHLCLLPLATLLENIAGVHVPLLAGATACLPPLAEVGLTGSSSFDVLQAITALSTWGATTAVTVPQMLDAFVKASHAGVSMPPSLRYLAVGGASMSSTLLRGALAAGLPVHEGYGLSECGSVVSVNRPGSNRTGSVGRPLDHVGIRIATDGEILVEGACWKGYLGDTASPNEDQIFATGDLGHLDDEGFLYITGRKRDVFITSYGRNVSPEWIEAELTAHPVIRQACVFGEARSFNSAVFVLDATATMTSVERTLERINETLPDYARVKAWLPADEPFSPTNGMLTFNGRLRRASIFANYANQLDRLYQQPQQKQSRALLRSPAGGHRA